MPAFSEEEISDPELDALIAYLNALRERLLSSPGPEGG
jgi:mono/diheme cytochrome c family protein